jgi:hypothetical protein
MISFFEIPRGVLERIDCFRSRFFWQGGNHKNKYRLAKWDILCQPKDQGGLEIQNIDVQNKCLPDEREMCPWAISKYFGD